MTEAFSGGPFSGEQHIVSLPHLEHATNYMGRDLDCRQLVGRGGRGGNAVADPGGEGWWRPCPPNSPLLNRSGLVLNGTKFTEQGFHFVASTTNVHIHERG